VLSQAGVYKCILESNIGFKLGIDKKII
jgi:hypothetical protein